MNIFAYNAESQHIRYSSQNLFALCRLLQTTLCLHWTIRHLELIDVHINLNGLLGLIAKMQRGNLTMPYINDFQQTYHLGSSILSLKSSGQVELYKTRSFGRETFRFENLKIIALGAETVGLSFSVIEFCLKQFSSKKFQW